MAIAFPKPEDFARILLSRLEIEQPANLADIASRIGLSIREVNSKGFDGALVRIPGKPRGIVAVKALASPRELGRQRFTIAHEIGHYVLPGHGSTSSICRDDQIEAWGQRVTNQENAANRFASEFLLPSEQITPFVKERSASFKTARSLSNIFHASLTAAALKCIEVTEDACALVVSFDGIIRRYSPSKSWRYIIPTGCKLGSGTLAKYLSEDTDEKQKSGVVSALAWAMGNKYMEMGAELLEDSILLSRYNIVLSILTAISG